jgi:hypothetical protein
MFCQDSLNSFVGKPVLDGLNGSKVGKVIDVSVNAPKFEYPHFLHTREKGVTTGVYPATVLKPSCKRALLDRVFDVRIIDGPIIKFCFLLDDKFEHKTPKPGDACRLYVERIRTKRANFKPHMPRRLKAVRKQ